MSTHSRHTLTVQIPAFNCPELLEKCLQGVAWADEIVVQDASTHEGVKQLLARKFPEVICVRNTEPDIRKRLISVAGVGRGDFVLWVHTDEFYDAAVGEEILASLRKPCDYDGFYIPSININFGENMGPGQSQLRLFRRDRFEFKTVEMHEMPSVPGKTATLTRPYAHVNNPFFILLVIKLFRYDRITVMGKSDVELQRFNLDQPGWRLWRQAALQWLHINREFFRHWWGWRKCRYAGVCSGYVGMIGALSRWFTSTEELRIRRGKLDRNDTRGYIDM